MTENRFQGQYAKVGTSEVSPNDKRLLHQSNKEIKVYLSQGQSAPQGREVQTGSGGGKYYTTEKISPHTKIQQKQSGNAQPPEMPGDYKKLVKISGNGVALSAAEYSYGIEIRAAKNAETKKFITQIKPEMAGVPEETQISKLKELAKKNGLIVETA
jgi:hypothetical protein